MKKNKLYIGLFAFMMAFFAAISPTIVAASTSSNPNYGVFQTRVNLGTTPSVVPPEIDSRYVEPQSNFTLSDDTHQGTFVADFNITALNTPVFDTFKVTNNTSSDIVLALTHEDQNAQPANSGRNLSDLLMCYNGLCDSGSYSPVGSQIPPVALGTVSAHSTMNFRFGMKLSKDANRAAWNGTGLTTTLYFGKMF